MKYSHRVAMSTKVAEVWTGVSSALEKDRCDEEIGGFEAVSGRNYFRFFSNLVGEEGPRIQGFVF
jgi:hypothetical protein